MKRQQMHFERLLGATKTASNRGAENTELGSVGKAIQERHAPCQVELGHPTLVGDRDR